MPEWEGLSANRITRDANAWQVPELVGEADEQVQPRRMERDRVRLVRVELDELDRPLLCRTRRYSEVLKATALRCGCGCALQERYCSTERTGAALASPRAVADTVNRRTAVRPVRVGS